MICSECGSYQPDRAKFCGICGAGMSQEGLVESFLRDVPDAEITLPRHRGLLFYAVTVLVVIALLAALAGAGYIVYLVAWSGGEVEVEDEVREDKSQFYQDSELGFSITYPEYWSLEMGYAAGDELTALTLTLSARKVMEVRAFRLDPTITIGGIVAIEEHLAEDATERILSLGGRLEPGQEAQPAAGQPMPGREEPSFPVEDEDEEEAPGAAGGAPQEPAQPEEETAGAAEGLFKPSRISGMPAFSIDFTANYMGEETDFILYYVVAGDLAFLFQGRAPSSEFQGVRPQFYSIIVSLKWEKTP